MGRAGCQGNCILPDLGVSCCWGPGACASLLEDTSPLGLGMGELFPFFLQLPNHSSQAAKMRVCPSQAVLVSRVGHMKGLCPRLGLLAADLW